MLAKGCLCQITVYFNILKRDKLKQNYHMELANAIS